MADIAVVGLDTGKRLFHLVGMDQTGRVVLRRRCSRSQLFAFFERLPPALVGMEACAGAHFLGRTVRGLGHARLRRVGCLRRLQAEGGRLPGRGAAVPVMGWSAPFWIALWSGSA